MRLNLYDPERNKRSVNLTNNYRSHPEIIKYSNEIFYNASMESMILAAEANLAIQWKQLPNPDIPVVFHSVESESKELKELHGASLFNIAEVEQVFQYVNNLITLGLKSGLKIKPEQIGVASPYSAQVRKLTERLKEYPTVDIGTTEFFQGREKPIMIISAVKTKRMSTKADFLDNPRVRRNVSFQSKVLLH